MRDARKRHGWRMDDLAGRCAALGAPQLSRQVLWDIEGGRVKGQRRRQVNVDEWVTIALALDVAPVNLLVPLDDDDAQCTVTPKVSDRAGIVRSWVRGHHALPGTERRMYYSYAPETELRRWEYLREMQDVHPGMFQVIPESEGK
jgi:hypothetical protein